MGFLIVAGLNGYQNVWNSSFSLDTLTRVKGDFKIQNFFRQATWNQFDLVIFPEHIRDWKDL